ncbi:hypothetical protein PC118_g20760 [Phytophthora cactorum]|uniref:Tc3 transposase DNA binding domain-containing protein n=1 Tax=Phytophthora cactorum TaxID=29920 RepID=A0A8T1F7T0_9STRA|nr:hypothetical protein PC113_g20904 [Phytophthora cactorum]KAG2878122.1 hypothetical protein PC114_g23279 [Phytophthora cactorum]KAG2886340.1 hypothetical protein PC115_g20708 [Phytophthora cactorum]KAG2896711.1 hypothetical protein PC117_g22936 [Phytophthora cactorum]KAG2963681.1 hypothetical protein PC118_g20760 [Phytophthora cactorum]
MGRGKALTNEKYWWVIGLHDGGVSLREIARRTDRSRSASRRAIKAERGPQSDDRGERPKAGRRPVLSDREVRQVVRAAATGDYFAAELKTKFSVTASVRTIPRLLKNVDHLVYTKMDRTLPLTAAHKSARMAWAEEPILNPGILIVLMKKSLISMALMATNSTGTTYASQRSHTFAGITVEAA